VTGTLGPHGSPLEFHEVMHDGEPESETSLRSRGTRVFLTNCSTTCGRDSGPIPWPVRFPVQ
jgi:hypothetical protein